MEIKVIEEGCIGCGACAQIAPDFFEMIDNAEGMAVAITKGKFEDLNEEQKKDALDAKDSCPTSTIVEE